MSASSITNGRSSTNPFSAISQSPPIFILPFPTTTTSTAFPHCPRHFFGQHFLFHSSVTLLFLSKPISRKLIAVVVFVSFLFVALIIALAAFLLHQRHRHCHHHHHHNFYSNTDPSRIDNLCLYPINNDGSKELCRQGERKMLTKMN